MGSSINTLVSVLQGRDLRPRVQGDCGKSFCPCCQTDGVHRSPGLSFRIGHDQPLVICCHGPGKCESSEVLAALGMTWGDFSDQPRSSAKKSSIVKRPARSQPVPATPEIGSTFKNETITTAYDYHDEDSNVIYRVCRTPSKQFPVARPDPKSPTGWYWGRGKVETALYRL